MTAKRCSDKGEAFDMTAKCHVNFLSLRPFLSLRTYVRSLIASPLHCNVTSNAREKSYLRKDLDNCSISRCLATFDMTTRMRST